MGHADRWRASRLDPALERFEIGDRGSDVRLGAAEGIWDQGSYVCLGVQERSLLIAEQLRHRDVALILFDHEEESPAVSIELRVTGSPGRIIESTERSRSPTLARMTTSSRT
jgi:hypothetical protein